MIHLRDVIGAAHGAWQFSQSRRNTEKYHIANPAKRAEWERISGKLTYKDDFKCFMRIIHTARFKRWLLRQAIAFV